MFINILKGKPGFFCIAFGYTVLFSVQYNRIILKCVFSDFCHSLRNVYAFQRGTALCKILRDFCKILRQNYGLQLLTIGTVPSMQRHSFSKNHAFDTIATIQHLIACFCSVRQIQRFNTGTNDNLIGILICFPHIYLQIFSQKDHPKIFHIRKCHSPKPLYITQILHRVQRSRCLKCRSTDFLHSGRNHHILYIAHQFKSILGNLCNTVRNRVLCPRILTGITYQL